jgi:hypothetical protein
MQVVNALYYAATSITLFFLFWPFFQWWNYVKSELRTSFQWCFLYTWADHNFSVMFFFNLSRPQFLSDVFFNLSRPQFFSDVFCFNLSRSQFLSDVFWFNLSRLQFFSDVTKPVWRNIIRCSNPGLFFSNLSRVQFFFSFNNSLILFIQICWVQIVICWSWEHRHWLLLYLVGCLHALHVDSFILVSHMVQCFKGTLRGRQILDLSMNLMISNVWSCLECLRSLSLSFVLCFGLDTC